MQPPIIERTCVFDAKIYKNVDGLFDVTCCWKSNKKKFKISDFCSALPSLLVEIRSNQNLKLKNTIAIVFCRATAA